MGRICALASAVLGLGVALLLHGRSAPAGPAGGAAAKDAAAEDAAAEGVALQARFEGEIKPLLKQHCFRCHGEGKSKGDLNLDRFRSLTSVQAEARLWRHMADVVQAGVMPPEERPALNAVERAKLTKWVEEALNYCDCSGPRDPGRVAIHRLNRT